MNQPDPRVNRVLQAQRVALMQLTTLALTLPMPCDIHVEPGDTHLVALIPVQGLPAWMAALDLTEDGAERESSSRDGLDRMTWRPDGLRLFTLRGYLPTLPALTAVPA